MQTFKDHLGRSIFLLIVILGVVSGSVVFFKPKLEASTEGSPSAFAISLPSLPSQSSGERTVSAPALRTVRPTTIQKISSVGSQSVINIGNDKVTSVNTKVTVEVPAGLGATYFSWDITSPSGKKEIKFGRKITFVPKETGNYFASLTYSKNPSDKFNLVVTSLPKAEFSTFSKAYTALQGTEASLKRSPSGANKAPQAKILLVYPSPVTEDKAIRFISYAFDPDGQISASEWKVGESPISSKAAFTALKTTAGTYSFTLTATDNSGATVSDTKKVIVNPLDKTQKTPQSDKGITEWEID